MWCKRVWRDLDLADPVNRSLTVGSDPMATCGFFFDVLRFCLTQEASMTAYDPGPPGTDDHFTRPFRAAELDSLLRQVHVEDVVGYRIKEDWIFDKQRSTLLVRIIGLAPLMEVRGSDGEFRGTRVLFWAYWPECRKALAQWPVSRQLPDGSRPSYEGLFRARGFSSLVVKVSNMQDRSLHEVLTGIDAVREAMKLERQLHDLERDLWHY
jgi:gliding motility associated protien GldN